MELTVVYSKQLFYTQNVLWFLMETQGEHASSLSLALVATRTWSSLCGNDLPVCNLMPSITFFFQALNHFFYTSFLSLQLYVYPSTVYPSWIAATSCFVTESHKSLRDIFASIGEMFFFVNCNCNVLNTAFYEHQSTKMFRIEDALFVVT